MLTIADKFFVAALIAMANGVRSRWGLDFGVDDAMAYDLVNGVGAALVWLWPNKSKSGPVPTEQAVNIKVVDPMQEPYGDA